MNEEEKRIIENLAHVKDAAAVLEHVNLDAKTPAESAVHAEIMAADALLAKGIDSLEALKNEAEKKAGESGGVGK